MAVSDGYWPGRSTVQRPSKRWSSQTCQRWPTTTTEDARLSNPTPYRSRTLCDVVKERPWKASFSYRVTCAPAWATNASAETANRFLTMDFMGDLFQPAGWGMGGALSVRQHTQDAIGARRGATLTGRR